jgi:error-prone DNA polymerase
MLSRLSDGSLPSGIERREHVGSWGRPPVSRHPRDVEIIPKSRDFH